MLIRSFELGSAGWRIPGCAHEASPTDAYPADLARRVTGDDCVSRNGVRNDRSRADHRVCADIAPRDDDRARADRGTDTDARRTDQPIDRPGEFAVPVQCARPTIVGQDDAGTDENAVLDRDPVVDECPVLDLDPIAEDDTLVNVRVASDDCIPSDPCARPELRAMPNPGLRPDAHVGFDLCR
jgi:hypothetical protein